MAATITSNTETDEELRAALADLDDVIVDGRRGAAKETIPPVEDKPTEPAEAPGEEIPVEAEGKSEAEAEAATEKQEAPEGEIEGEKKHKGGFQAKIEKLTARVDNLREQLEDEQGSKKSLRAKLDEALTELETFRGGKKSEEPPKDAGPVIPKRPKMPTLASVDFDTDKFAAAEAKHETAMEKYDADMTAYLQAAMERTAEDRVAAERHNNVEAQLQRELKARVDKGAEDYSDYWDLVKRLPENAKFPLDEFPAAMALMKVKSKHPASLFHYFMVDFLDNDNVEGERIAALDPIDQVLELKDIELRLASERADKAAKKEPASTAPPKEPPAQPKPTRRVPDPPLDPVGGGGSVKVTGNLQEQYSAACDAGNSGEIKRLARLMDTEAASRKAAQQGR